MLPHSPADPRQDGATPRYLTLDAMRGVAALCVALFHFDLWGMQHGYLAVDFFFGLSGFVLARTYAPRFANGLGIGPFMARQIVRLYPLFLLGTILAGVVFVQRAALGASNPMPAGDAGWTFLLGLAMLPSPLDQPLFPLNVPSWSLFFEILANVALAACLLRVPRAALAAIVLACSAGLVPILLAHGTGNIGALWSEIGVASLRTGYSFGFGVLIARLASAPPLASRWAALLVVAAIVALLALPRTGYAAYDVAVIMIASPLLLWVGTRVQLTPALAAPATFLGDVSYALYAVHWPLIEPMRDLRDRFGVPAPLADALFLGAMVLVAWAAVRWFDEPLRRRFGAWQRSRRIATIALAART